MFEVLIGMLMFTVVVLGLGIADPGSESEASR